METNFCFFGIYFLLLGTTYFVTFLRHSQEQLHEKLKETLSKHDVTKVAILQAHPDDEVVFFAPSILMMIDVLGANNVFILCVTSGNYSGLGELRKKELRLSAKRFGIPKENVIQFDNRHFLDNPDSGWLMEVLLQHVENVLHKKHVDSIVTFGKHGVSNHKNHKSLHMLAKKHLCRRFNCLLLDDVIRVRKYLPFVDVIYTSIATECMSDQVVTLTSFSNMGKALRAMLAHHTQLEIQQFTNFYSRYIFVNSLTIHQKEKSLTYEQIGIKKLTTGYY